ncbi:MAG TPA: hypothetical protein VFA90_08720 [Terriglobales bacterium]|nr:hypothetical protein [Terriglobales bacterium]
MGFDEEDDDEDDDEELEPDVDEPDDEPDAEPADDVELEPGLGLVLLLGTGAIPPQPTSVAAIRITTQVFTGDTPALRYAGNSQASDI